MPSISTATPPAYSRTLSLRPSRPMTAPSVSALTGRVWSAAASEPAPLKVRGSVTSMSLAKALATASTTGSVAVSSPLKSAGLATLIWKDEALPSEVESPTVSTLALRSWATAAEAPAASPIARMRCSTSARVMARRPSALAVSPVAAGRVTSVIVMPPRNSVSSISRPLVKVATMLTIASTMQPSQSTPRLPIQSMFGRSAEAMPGKIVVMNGRLLRFRTVVHTSSSTRVTTMAVKSVVITPMAMVSAKPFTSVAATLYSTTQTIRFVMLPSTIALKARL